ncbi:MAG: TetR/AcrR family transcriptional regulator [Lachnospiraceae bacterium]
MKTDIRIQVTKKILKDSLLELMLITPFDKITIKDICSQANVSRSTFYSHYEDIYSLLRDFEQDLYKNHKIEELISEGTPKSQVLNRRLCAMLTKVNEHNKFYRIYLDNMEAGFVTNVLDEHGKEMVSSWIKSGLFDSRRDAEYAFLFYKSGAIACIQAWLKEPDSDRKSPEEFATSLMKIFSLPPGYSL